MKVSISLNLYLFIYLFIRMIIFALDLLSTDHEQ